ncbi:lytic murein transglycosylase [Desulfobacter curvatus]|uniref:lytic murein transglycosylase n=1 Tax=Desulfobacter curvatus TaxID=2290 RepID=UPI000360D2E8|nr:lytic murein transglycosylase [Desulfobacter curvatus]
MKNSQSSPKFILSVVVLLIICFSVNFCYAQQADVPDVSGETNDLYRLTQRLVKDGFDPEKIKALFDNKAVFFDPGDVSLFFIHSESSLNYDQFSSPKSIVNAQKYMVTYKESLDKAQEEFSVDKTIITAILMVETRLGTYLGNRTVINTLSTMAALTDQALAERVWHAISDNKKPGRAIFDKKVDQKSRWGYEELKALIRYADREGIDPVAIKGSYAGAMGIPQFMPSNALTLAKDGNKDGRVDLFDHDDAIFSVANYLKHYGWKSGLSRQRQHEVLFQYNHSNYYVDALLKISDKLK